MKPYSDGLRKRVLAACAAGEQSVGAVAAQFRVSVSFVHKLRRRQRTTGSSAALPHRGGPAPLLDAAARAEATACVARQPDATLDELRDQLVAARGRRAGRGPHYGLAGVADAGLAAQKKSVHTAERDTERVKDLRRAFLEALPGEDVTRIKFVDETSVNLTYTRRRGATG